MNNQAAQTMPELPGPFDVIEQVDKYNFVHNVEVYTADQMHQYARDYAAALSQTAGVAEGFVMVPIVPTEAMKSAGAACFPNRWGNGDETDGEDAADCYREMLSAASDHQQNAAQGGGNHG